MWKPFSLKYTSSKLKDLRSKEITNLTSFTTLIRNTWLMRDKFLKITWPILTICHLWKIEQEYCLFSQQSHHYSQDKPPLKESVELSYVKVYFQLFPCLLAKCFWRGGATLCSWKENKGPEFSESHLLYHMLSLQEKLKNLENDLTQKYISAKGHTSLILAPGTEAGRSLEFQARVVHEFNPENLHSVRRKLTPTSCLLTSTCTM